MRVGIITFPGSTCTQDAMAAVRRLGHAPVELWYEGRDLRHSEALILPGRRGAGGPVRCGDISQLSAIMEEVVAFARRGGPVLGICDGFQLLIKAGLLPGLLLPSASRRFISRTVELAVENTWSPFTRFYSPGEHIHAMVAHMDARYFIDADGLHELEDMGRVAFRFVEGPDAEFHGIAGLLNEQGNVLGMMPHPEHVLEPVLDGMDGERLFESFLS